MKNKELWEQKHFKRDKKGRIIGEHMHKIIGNAYEPVIKEHCSGVLVDLGCGEVPYYFLYKDKVKDAICIDWGREVKEGEVRFFDKEADLNEGVPLESEIADTILCTDVLEHIAEPGFLFQEIARVMKPNGKLILTVPFMYWIHDAPHDNHRYTKFMLERYCRKNHLTVLDSYAYGGLPEVLYNMVHQAYYFYGMPFRRAFYFVWRHLGRFLHRRKAVKRLSEKSREQFPLGYILIAQKNGTQ